jgi:DNA repair exonuclease SbcCD ATPase subunit
VKKKMPEEKKDAKLSENAVTPPPRPESEPGVCQYHFPIDDKARCLTHKRLKVRCDLEQFKARFDASEDRVRVITDELAEAKKQLAELDTLHEDWKATAAKLEKERDAARANCEQQRKLAMDNWKGMCEARAEIEALRAEVEYLRLGLAPAEYSPGGSNMVVSCQSCGFQISWSSDSASPVCGKCRSTSWNIKTTARLAPAPAPKEASQ